MDKPLLSICIPTYNRSVYLEKCLDSVVSQKEFYNGRVEVIISDNNSDDDTEFVGSKYASVYEDIKYFKNKENIRDRNFPLALSRGSGIYRHLCNDTILFENGALKEICEIIEKNQASSPHIVWANGSAKCKEEILLTNFQNYMYDMSFWITSIACFGLWESECSGIADDTVGCEQSLWQVRKGLELASQRRNILIVNKKLKKVQEVKNKNISYGLYKVFYQNYFSILQPYFEQELLSAEVKEYLEKDLLFNFFADWCIRWELGAKNFQYSKTEDLRDVVYQQYKDKGYWAEYSRYYKKRLIAIRAKSMFKRLIRR